MSATLTVQALAQITLASFNESVSHMTPAISETLSNSLERFLRDEISYEELTGIVSSAVGVTQPLDRLRAILATPPVPIPCPPSHAPGNGTRRQTRIWSAYEDQRLLAGIYRCGIENWTAISRFVGNGRTRSQCSQRWYRGLNPRIRKDQWSPEEEQRLIALVAQHGDKSWTNISVMLGNRSDVQCRYRYQQLQKDRQTEPRIRFAPAYRLPSGPIAIPFSVLNFAQPTRHPADPGQEANHAITAPKFDGSLYSVC
jgi:hypothetical protein